MSNPSAQPHDSMAGPSFETLQQHASHAEQLSALQREIGRLRGRSMVAILWGWLVAKEMRCSIGRGKQL